MDIAKCLLAFGVQSDDRLMLIREQHLAEANFVLSYLMRQIVDEDNQLILILTHNSLAHYNCVAKRLGYNLMQKVEEKRVRVIDFQAMTLDALNAMFHGNEETSELLDTLIRQMRHHVDDCMPLEHKLFIVVDNVSHLYDHCAHLGDRINFINCFIGQYFNEANICYVLSYHLHSMQDKLLSRDLEYSASSVVDVSLLKTGRSSDVSGIMKILRNRKLSIFHYKTRQYGVDLYTPGELLFQ